jgi:RNA polymerase sigma factor (sigma-70 family)
MEDLELLALWQKGDKAAGNELCARHFDVVYRFFEYKVDDPNDLVQKTFLNFVGSYIAFRGEASVRTYLFVIARNVLREHYRKEPKQRHSELHMSSLEELTSSMALKLHRNRETQRLLVALRKLKADDQLLLELHYWQELDAPALAMVFELEPGAVRVRLHRARKELRKLMGHDLFAKLREDPIVSSIAALAHDVGSD